MRGIS